MQDIVHRKLSELRELTPARVALPTTGSSIATSAVLAFQQAHALARDAVHVPLDMTAFAQRMKAEIPGLKGAGIDVIQLQSHASDRSAYLRHPHLGRSLSPESAAQLQPSYCDLAIVIADGLSSKAVKRNAIPVLAHLLPMLLSDGWTVAPIALVQQGRVAIGDPIGHGLGVKCSLVLIGERPGLSCSTSLGAYITWAPHPQCTDANRVCLSNMHEDGIQPSDAAGKLMEYLQVARMQGRTGTALGAGLSLA
jgi:ethanolamine ammonia-lyase small subunit